MGKKIKPVYYVTRADGTLFEKGKNRPIAVYEIIARPDHYTLPGLWSRAAAMRIAAALNAKPTLIARRLFDTP